MKNTQDAEFKTTNYTNFTNFPPQDHSLSSFLSPLFSLLFYILTPLSTLRTSVR